MALLIHLSLLLATAQLPSCFSGKKDINCASSSANSARYTVGNWTWTVKCFSTSGNPSTVEVMAETLDHCMQKNSPDVSKTSCLSMKAHKQSIKLFLKGNDKCEEHSGHTTSSSCQEQDASKCVNFMQGEKMCFSLPSEGNKKLKMKFKCTQPTQQHPVSICNHTDVQFHLEKKSWIDALEYCQEKKSSLLEITNQSKDCVKNQLSQHNSSSQTGAWIGLERSIFGNNPNWQWISGSQFNYSQWNSSFPVNSLNNHCGKIILVNETKEIKWQDANCHDKLPFICQSLKSIPYPAEAELCTDTHSGQSSNCS